MGTYQIKAKLLLNDIQECRSFFIEKRTGISKSHPVTITRDLALMLHDLVNVPQIAALTEIIAPGQI
jgi:hypothetical protein